MRDRPAAPDDPPAGRSRAAAAWVLLLGAALLLRLIGNRHGLPWMEEPDAEHVGLAQALANGTADPERLLELQRYPHLLTLVLWPLMELFPATPGVWLGRVVSALLGTATVVYVFRLGALLRGAAAGWVAAAFAALSFLGVQHAHLVKPHVAVTFFLAAATFHATRAAASGERRELVVAGAFGALAAATLHSGFLAVVPIAVAAALARAGLGPLVKAAVLVGLALPLAYPGLLIAAWRYLFGGADATVFLGSHAAVMTESLGLAGLKRVPVFLLECEPVATLLAALAVVAGLATRARWLRLALPGLALLVICALLFGRIRSFAPRMLLPALPPLFALAGVAVAAAAARLGGDRRRLVLPALATLLLLPGAAVAARTAWLWTREDTRVLAKRWLDEHLPADAVVAAVPYLDAPLPLTPASIEAHVSCIDATTEWDRRLRSLQRDGPLDPARFGRTYTVRFPFRGRWTADGAARRARLAELGATHGLSFFFSSAEEQDPGIAVFGELGEVVLRIEPGTTRNSGAWVYRVRWPYATLWGLERPGPVVEVVELGGA